MIMLGHARRRSVVPAIRASPSNTPLPRLHKTPNEQDVCREAASFAISLSELVRVQEELAVFSDTAPPVCIPVCVSDSFR